MANTRNTGDYDNLSEDELRAKLAGRTDANGQPLTPAGDRDGMIRQLQESDTTNR
jgi:hypothetical protein